MKKTVWIVLALLLVFAALAAWAFSRGEAEPASTAAPEETAASEESVSSVRHVDMAKLRSAYDREAVYATVGDREILWGEYYDWLGVDIVGLEYYMSNYATMGYDTGWESLSSDGDTLAAQTVDELNDVFRFHEALDRLAAENGAEISEQELDGRVAEYRLEAVGADGTDEDWTAWLSGNFISEGIFRSNIRYTMIYERLVEVLYGTNGEKLSAARLQHFIEDQELLRFRYLFFLTIDPLTGAALEDAEADAVRARAEAAAEELLSVETKDERLARFEALAAELQAEDAERYYVAEYVSTASSLPEIYTNAILPLKDYEYEPSGLVSDDYGIYLFLRLPVDAESELADGSTVGAQAALSAVSVLVQEEMEQLPFVYAEGVAPLDLLSYLED